MTRTVPLSVFHHSSVPFASVNTTSIGLSSASLPALIRSAKVGALVMALVNGSYLYSVSAFGKRTNTFSPKPVAFFFSTLA